MEEDVLDGAERVFLQETESLDEEGGQEGGEECGLDRQSSQLWVILFGTGVRRRG